MWCADFVSRTQWFWVCMQLACLNSFWAEYHGGGGGIHMAKKVSFHPDGMDEGRIIEIDMQFLQCLSFPNCI